MCWQRVVYQRIELINKTTFLWLWVACLHDHQTDFNEECTSLSLNIYSGWLISESVVIRDWCSLGNEHTHTHIYIFIYIYFFLLLLLLFFSPSIIYLGSTLPVRKEMQSAEVLFKMYGLCLLCTIKNSVHILRKSVHTRVIWLRSWMAFLREWGKESKEKKECVFTPCSSFLAP